MIFLPILIVLLSLFAWSVIPAGSRTAVPGSAKHRRQQGEPRDQVRPSAPPAPALLGDDGSPLWTTRDDRQLERLLKRAARAAGSDSAATDAAHEAP